VRSYDVAVASLAIDAPTKWTDNLLSQHSIPDVVSARRGVTRRITHPVLIRIALIRQLHTSIGVSVADAVRIAADLLRPDTPAVYLSGQVSVHVNFKELERVLDDRLAGALESAPSPRRGRPARKPEM